MSYYIHVTDAAERDIQEAYDYIDLTLKNKRDNLNQQFLEVFENKNFLNLLL